MEEEVGVLLAQVSACMTATEEVGEVCGLARTMEREEAEEEALWELV